MLGILLRDPSLLAIALKATRSSDPKRMVELGRCPKCNHPVGHYADERRWHDGKYWHLIPPGGWPCNKVEDF